MLFNIYRDAMAQAGANPLSSSVRNALVIGGAVMVVLLLISFRMTITVTGERIQWSMGAGFPRWSAPVREIAAVQIVRNPWYYGWGIRLTPSGMLYSVSGFQAVELSLRGGKTIRIGSDEPEALAAAINQVKRP